MNKSNIYIVRHGESLATIYSAAFSKIHPPSIPLTEYGYEQAVYAGKKIAADTQKTGRNIRIYHSPFRRIADSSTAVIEGYGKDAEIIEEPLLLERDHGSFDGLSLSEQQKLDPETFHLLESGTWREKFITRMPNGESMEDVHHRVDAFIQKIRAEAESNPDIDFVIVTHGAICKLLEDILSNHPASWLKDFDVPNTGSVIKISTNFIEPAEPEIMHTGDKRNKSNITLDSLVLHCSESEQVSIIRALQL